jgi:tripartite-type tricarboxylate transporter receptor subunit TctC
MIGVVRSPLMSRAAAAAIGCVAFGALAHLAAVEARAEGYPARAVTIVVPFPAGSSALDFESRMLAEKLTERLGQPFVVENRPGAGGLIATAAVAKADPDGYTLLSVGTGLAINAALHKSLPYDPVTDFVPLALTSYFPFILVVNPALAVHSVQDLVTLAKEKPGQLSYGSPAPGSAPHLAAELFKHATGIDIVHVAYKGSPLTDLMGGHIQLMFADPTSSLPLIAAGKVRALGVTSRTRIVQAPDIPTLAEAGVPGFEAVAWNMLVAPSKTPPEILGKLRAELKTVLALPEIQARIVKAGLTPAADTRSHQELAQFVKAEIARLAGVLDDIGMARSE